MQRRLFVSDNKAIAVLLGDDALEWAPDRIAIASKLATRTQRDHMGCDHQPESGMMLERTEINSLT